MEITVNEESLFLDDDSQVKIEGGGYDLEIIEPGFDPTTAKIIKGGFVSKQIYLPPWIEVQINRTRELPCSGLHQDEAGKKKFSAYFD